MGLSLLCTISSCYAGIHLAGSVVLFLPKPVVEEEKDLALRVIGMKADVNRLVEAAELHQAQRLTAEDSGKFEAYAVEMDIIEKLKRIYYHSKKMAKSVVEIAEEAAVVVEAAA